MENEDRRGMAEEWWWKHDDVEERENDNGGLKLWGEVSGV